MHVLFWVPVVRGNHSQIRKRLWGSRQPAVQWKCISRQHNKPRCLLRHQKQAIFKRESQYTWEGQVGFVQSMPSWDIHMVQWGPFLWYSKDYFLMRELLVVAMRITLDSAGINSQKYASHSFRIYNCAMWVILPNSLIKTLGRWENVYQKP